MSAERVFREAMAQLKLDLEETNRRNDVLNHNLGLLYQSLAGVKLELERLNANLEKKGMKSVLREGRKLTQTLGDLLA